MDMKDVAPSVRSIKVITGSDLDDDRTVRVVYQRLRSRKKQTKALKPVEKMVRHFARGQVAAGQRYLQLHEKSNQSKRNGWLKSSLKNMRKARKTFKKEAG